jgi:hypothetical protein
MWLRIFCLHSAFFLELKTAKIKKNIPWRCSRDVTLFNLFLTVYIHMRMRMDTCSYMQRKETVAPPVSIGHSRAVLRGRS